MDDLLSIVVFKTTGNLIPPEKTLIVFEWVFITLPGDHYPQFPSMSPIATRLYFFLIAIYRFSFSLCFLLLIFPSLDDMLTFCKFLSVFQDSGRVYFISLAMICLLLWSPPACYFSLQNRALGLCVI